MELTLLFTILAVILVISIICAFAWYRIVDPSEAHLVVTPKGKFVVSSDDKVSKQGIRTYFAIPHWLPYFGRAVRIMDVTIKELVVDQETIEKDQARFNVTSSMKYRVSDVITAAETFISDEELQNMLKEVVKSGVRATTVKYDVKVVRAKKKEMEDEVRKEIEDDLAKWGLSLENFQLVEFSDTDGSSVISDISKIREKEIEATRREQNAEKDKTARMKEAEADEKARQREIQKEQRIGEQEQEKKQLIAEKEKVAREKEYEVIKVQTIKQAEIDKEKAEIIAKQQKEVAIIKANQDKEAEEINKKKKELEGQGDRIKAEEIAKGQAAPIKEVGQAEADIIKAKGLAEAEAKNKLQEALNKFKDEAIRALVAEKVVEKDKAVGIEAAKALGNADVKLFSGGQNDKQGFDLGKMIESVGVASGETSDSLLNRIGRPNDLGFTALGMKKVSNDVNKKEENKTSFSPESTPKKDIEKQENNKK